MSFWLFLRNTENSYNMTWAIPDSNLDARGLFQRAVVTAETDKFRIARFACYLHGFLVSIINKRADANDICIT